ncbi:hypothetical protein [Pedobacter sp. MW01-1-1]|uniref:hypothetical protein n=1 Tax=Pedobacter sp. MW01-1-1 TaxID=3383027 RepID=UPI003FF0BED2
MANPELDKEVIFYHDSDIIFTQLPNFDMLLKDNNWYSSDTSTYTSTKFLKGIGDNELSRRMCTSLNISKKVFERNNGCRGGAQYILKYVDHKFWEEIEEISENLFRTLINYKSGTISTTKLQPWCADMWCLWFAAIKRGVFIETHSELDFSWAHSKLSEKRKIIHYTGSIPPETTFYFRKNNYNYCTPFYDDFLNIDKNSCSYPVILEIQECGANRSKKTSLSNSAVILICDSSMALDFGIIKIIIKHIKTTIRCEIIILETGNTPQLKTATVNHEVNYLYFPTINVDNLLKELLSTSSADFFIIQTYGFILNEKNLKSVINSIKKYRGIRVPFTQILKVDSLLFAMFSKLLDIKLFNLNKGKMLKFQQEQQPICLVGNRIDLEKLLAIYFQPSLIENKKMLISVTKNRTKTAYYYSK